MGTVKIEEEWMVVLFWRNGDGDIVIAALNN